MAPSVVFGDYFLLGRLNRGGMAEVYLARGLREPLTDKLLAIKRTRPELSTDQDFVSMFMDEATIARGLVHPNICHIYDQGRHGDVLFIVMEFIHGKDLRVVQHRARERQELVPYNYTAFALARVAEALDCAHNKTNASGDFENIVHRDVSPQNVLISYDGVPKLIDFGIAKAKSRIARTQVGVLKGKFAYMSPEQASGLAIDRRTDVFALGVVLYELVTGKSAFKGANDFSTLQRITQARYTPPAEVNADVPKALVAIIEKALARELDQRYPNAAALAADLDAYLASEPAPPTPAVLAAYMRGLFKDDYLREAARIKTYIAAKPPQHLREETPGKGPLGSAGPAAERTEPEEESDATGIAPSTFRPRNEAVAQDDEKTPATELPLASTVILERETKRGPPAAAKASDKLFTGTLEREPKRGPPAAAEVYDTIPGGKFSFDQPTELVVVPDGKLSFDLPTEGLVAEPDRKFNFEQATEIAVPREGLGLEPAAAQAMTGERSADARRGKADFEQRTQLALPGSKLTLEEAAAAALSESASGGESPTKVAPTAQGRHDTGTRPSARFNFEHLPTELSVPGDKFDFSQPTELVAVPAHLSPTTLDELEQEAKAAVESHVLRGRVARPLSNESTRPAAHKPSGASTVLLTPSGVPPNAGRPMPPAGMMLEPTPIDPIAIGTLRPDGADGNAGKGRRPSGSGRHAGAVGLNAEPQAIGHRSGSQKTGKSGPKRAPSAPRRIVTTESQALLSTTEILVLVALALLGLATVGGVYLYGIRTPAPVVHVPRS